jgi:hypothetical protein
LGLVFRAGFRFCAMTCRLFIDEVGNDDLTTASERFLSLTGITTKVHGHDHQITPALEVLKNRIFGHNPPQYPVILHRQEIRRREKPFDCLQDEKVNSDWEASILQLIESLPYIANTVLIDKQEHSQRYGVWQFHPYHYCMRALLERYVLWLNRHRLMGDVVVEPRYKQQDKRLKRSFSYVYDNGTENIPATTFQRCLTSREIKFEPKEANVCGLQLVELIAHPSHQAIKAQITGEPMTAPFGKRIVDILKRSRYRRNPKTGAIEGWGQKKLP